MRVHQWISARVSRGIVLAVGLALSGALLAVAETRGAPAETKGKIDASIFSYDGQDFVRTQTTLLTKEGKSAVNTKLAHDTPAYKALMDKHSYTGDATIFGREYQADYAPLTSEDGKLTGALFVGVSK
ncbi:MAG: Cache 3/Cache 2 fusion domain-containing protein [Gemmatimonadales bacterium]